MLKTSQKCPPPGRNYPGWFLTCKGERGKFSKKSFEYSEISLEQRKSFFSEIGFQNIDVFATSAAGCNDVLRPVVECIQRRKSQIHKYSKIQSPKKEYIFLCESDISQHPKDFL